MEPKLNLPLNMITSKPKEIETVGSRESEGLRYLRRFSSIKREYENEKRKSLSSASKSRPPALTAIESRQTVLKKLWSTTSSWKMQDLYVETLCALFPSPESRRDTSSKSLMDFLQKLFRFDSSTHQACMEVANRRKMPEWVLNVEIIEAKDLPPTDVNGLSDPFCTLAWSRRRELTFRTSVCPETLNPVWNAFFTIPLTGKESDQDSLKITVWDQDPEERKRDKLKKISEVKSPHGLKLFLKDITTSKAKQELIGTVTIPAKHTESAVIDKWFPLENPSGRGQLRVRMALGLQKDKVEGMADYKKVIQLLVIHDIENGPTVEPFSWAGKFAKNNWTDFMLRQLGWTWSLKPHQVLLCQWVAYNRIHLELPLNTSILPELLSTIFCSLESSIQYRLEEYSEFWSAVRRLILYIEEFVLNVHSRLHDNKISAQAEDLLKTISILYDNLKNQEGIQDLHITASKLINRIQEALVKGALLHFQSVVEQHELTSTAVEGNTVKKLKRICAIGTILQENLQIGYKKLQPAFNKTYQLNYFVSTYRAYDSEFANLVEPTVDKICQRLTDGQFQPAHIGEMNSKDNDEYTELTTQLFTLFLAVKQFAQMSTEFPGTKVNLRIAGVYHTWFRPAVLHWWESLRCVITPCIKKAVELEAVEGSEIIFCESLKASVSYEAISVASTLNEIAIVWKNLDWPIVEESYDFVINILTQLWAHAMYYTQLISDKVDTMDTNSKPPYLVSKMMCICLNNITYVAEEGSKPVIEGIDVKGFLGALAATSGTEELAAASAKIERLHADSKEIISEEVSRILDKTVNRMRPEIKKFFMRATERENDVGSASEAYIEYMDLNLRTLKANLTAATFNIAFKKLWSTNLNIMTELIQLGQNRSKSSNFFSSLDSMFSIMKGLFYWDKDSFPVTSKPELQLDLLKRQTRSSDPALEISSILRIHKAETLQLKLLYYQDRYQNQVMGKTEHGVITVKIHYSQELSTMVVMILNAKHLQSYDSNGSSDPYVEMEFVPNELHEHTPRHQTEVQKLTLFPLFDETINIKLSSARLQEGGFLRFGVYDHDYFGTNDFHGEAFYPLESVELTEKVPKAQLSLNLDKPSASTDSILKILETRQWDKSAVKFVKNEYKKQVIVQAV